MRYQIREVSAGSQGSRVTLDPGRQTAGSRRWEAASPAGLHCRWEEQMFRGRERKQSPPARPGGVHPTGSTSSGGSAGLQAQGCRCKQANPRDCVRETPMGHLPPPEAPESLQRHSQIQGMLRVSHRDAIHLLHGAAEVLPHEHNTELLKKN